MLLLYVILTFPRKPHLNTRTTLGHCDDQPNWFFSVSYKPDLTYVGLYNNCTQSTAEGRTTDVITLQCIYRSLLLVLWRFPWGHPFPSTLAPLSPPKSRDYGDWDRGFDLHTAPLNQRKQGFSPKGVSMLLFPMRIESNHL